MRVAFPLSAFCSLILAGLSMAVQADELPMGAVLFQNVCAACHGPKGQGNEALKAPSIAGQPAWYVLAQLGNFREGRRGTNPAEPQAMIMAAIVKTLGQEHLEAVASHIGKLELVSPPSPSVLRNVDLAMGKELFEVRCMECHRFNASGEMTFGSPPLVGLQDWYLLAQINQFKNARRGTRPGDQNGAKMALSSQFIEDEQAKHSVIAYILTLNASSTDPDRLFVQPSK